MEGQCETGQFFPPAYLALVRLGRVVSGFLATNWNISTKHPELQPPVLLGDGRATCHRQSLNSIFESTVISEVDR